MYGTFYAPNDYRNYLEHFGIKGMKWGVRRYQNADGSYTSAGKSRYGVGDGQSYEGVKSVKGNLHRLAAKNYDLNARAWEKMGNKTAAGIQRRFAEDSRRKAETADQAKAQKLASKKQLTPEEKEARNAKIAKFALAVTGTAAVAAGAYVAHKYGKRTMAEAESALKKAAEQHKKTYDAELMSLIDRMSNSKGTSQESTWRQYASAKARDRDTFHRIVDSHANSKSTRRAAQRAVIRRDLANAKAKSDMNRRNRQAMKVQRRAAKRGFTPPARNPFQYSDDLNTNRRLFDRRIDDALRRSYTAKASR